ncbi:hypothetical protein FOXG_17485 [Fusarium oxysporum f. sp. lycopersici 4287]|uniref:Uncharacterized protein n=3 Tax=Fusarium oxysporum TaxID=5507 RepID=A0A0J9WCT3_FUSO4|nr:uncharacterized protein FOXG_17485 [Fusarium oxysporum f. sp. lycopersici 4287]EXK24509.1 hypothetical protein FOMG_18768 [Fusarium oxysporum f. sp. melonis 26406]KNB20416.1 hypothetical protein FOXG_17485 [Fusarium oxysporum f. sp. lycopersici 4287]
MIKKLILLSSVRRLMPLFSVSTSYKSEGLFMSMLSPDSIPGPSEAAQGLGTYFDDWIANVQWLNPESIDWNFWDEILQLGLSEVPS